MIVITIRDNIVYGPTYFYQWRCPQFASGAEPEIPNPRPATPEPEIPNPDPHTPEYQPEPRPPEITPHTDEPELPPETPDEVPVETPESPPFPPLSSANRNLAPAMGMI